MKQNGLILTFKRKCCNFLLSMYNFFDMNLCDSYHQLRQLEEIRGCSKSPKSSCASTTSSGTLMSDGHVSSLDFSPKSLEKHCRPIDHVKIETEIKGTLIERLDHVEDRVLKVIKDLKCYMH